MSVVLLQPQIKEFPSPVVFTSAVSVSPPLGFLCPGNTVARPHSVVGNARHFLLPPHLLSLLQLPWHIHQVVQGSAEALLAVHALGAHVSSVQFGSYLAQCEPSALDVLSEEMQVVGHMLQLVRQPAYLLLSVC